MSPSWRAISFDCFGTLIDWKFGQSRVLRQLPSLSEHSTQIERLMEVREIEEQKIQADPWRPYSEILALSIGRACREVCQIDLPQREAEAFAAGQLGWPAFPETTAALQRLSAHLPVVLLSNCDQQTLELAARKHLGIQPSLVVSSESVQSYKPRPAHWHALLSAAQCEASEILHVSFSPTYDLDPAQELGFGLGFVQRYGMEAPRNLKLQVVAKDLEDLVNQALA